MEPIRELAALHEVIEAQPTSPEMRTAPALTGSGYTADGLTNRASVAGPPLPFTACAAPKYVRPLPATVVITPAADT